MTQENSVMRAEVLRSLPDIVNYSPTWIRIEPTNQCNLNCKMCPRLRVQQQYGAGDISLADFKKIILKFPFLEHVHIQGFGEPFLNPEIFDMIAFAKSRGLYVSTIINGSLLNNDTIDAILKSGLDELAISVDSVDKKKYELIRVGANFDALLCNLESLCKSVQRNNSKLYIRLATVLFDKTFAGLADIVELAKSLGVKQVFAQEVHPAHQYGLSRREYTPSANNNSEFSAVVAECESLARSYDIKLEVKRCQTSKKRVNCDRPWITTFVDYKGNVFPCHFITETPMGNILREDFSEIWNGDSYISFRKLLKNGDLPRHCLDCTWL